MVRVPYAGFMLAWLCYLSNWANPFRTTLGTPVMHMRAENDFQRIHDMGFVYAY